MCRIILATFALIFVSSPASARFVPFWRYEELLSKADVVVIATPVFTAAAKEKMTDERWRDCEFIGVHTQFALLSVLKGKSKVKDGKMTLLHYRMQAKPDARKTEAIIDGPNLVSFKIAAKPGKGEAVLVQRGGYLLFLKSRKDGRFEPVTGQIDPLFSVRELSVSAPEE